MTIIQLGIYECVSCGMERNHEQNKRYGKYLGWYCPNCRLYSIIKKE